MTKATPHPDRSTGRYYTPPFLVEVMLRLALLPLCENRKVPLRILDPACGDGAFLLAISKWLEDHNRDEAGSVEVCQLFGVDIDRAALNALGSRSPVNCRVHWGDALTGRGFGEPADSKPQTFEDAGEVPKLDWPTTFPQVARDGGFDLVIGNPPYRRELASKPALDRLKKSALAKTWQQPRLDLWAYFLHRGLDLVRDGGRLAFVLPSYWTASRSAAQLIERLRTETTLRDVVLLGPSRVFPGVSGRHLILSLEKSAGNGPCRVWDLADAGDDLAEQLARLPEGETGRDGPPLAGYLLEQSELFQLGQLCLSQPDPQIRKLEQRGSKTLGDRFQVRQGIVENPRSITPRIAEKSSNIYQAGQGVFVLSSEEVRRLGLSAEESKLLRPYYSGRDIGRFSLSDAPSEFLLYLTRETAPDLEAFPRIADHLARFRPLLENRREVRRGRIAWWHLHWPRQEATFLAPRILMPQMGRHPRFVFCEKPAFVGFSLHVISRREISPDRASSESLLALTGLLNSELASRWFRRFAKHRGASLDISGTVLRRFTLPADDPELEQTLADLVRQRQQLPSDCRASQVIEAEIETLVGRWSA